MPLIQLQRVDYSVGGPLLLEHVDLAIEPNERVCVVGRNGEGKSTLLRLLAGDRLLGVVAHRRRRQFGRPDKATNAGGVGLPVAKGGGAGTDLSGLRASSQE